jgi:hypothetical protein
MKMRGWPARLLWWAARKLRGRSRRIVVLSNDVYFLGSDSVWKATYHGAEEVSAAIPLCWDDDLTAKPEEA